MLLVPREEDLAIAVWAMEGPRFPHDAFREDGNPTVNPALVVVKADQTAKGGECGECGAPVGKYWSDCLKCGAVFG